MSTLVNTPIYLRIVRLGPGWGPVPLARVRPPACPALPSIRSLSRKLAGERCAATAASAAKTTGESGTWMTRTLTSTWTAAQLPGAAAPVIQLLAPRLTAFVSSVGPTETFVVLATQRRRSGERMAKQGEPPALTSQQQIRGSAAEGHGGGGGGGGVAENWGGSCSAWDEALQDRNSIATSSYSPCTYTVRS
ncbi:hypothetical protein C0J52_26927 [Blattella germanica]|nr:hypothetical protein C0J52_26927 [Blattella germanica]